MSENTPKSKKSEKPGRMVPIIRRRSEDGDTLVEVLLALVVLGLASVALLVGFGTVISSSAVHRTLSNENLALESAAEQLTSAIQTSTSPNYLEDACGPGNTTNYTVSSYPDDTLHNGNGLSITEGNSQYYVNYASSNGIQYWNGSSYAAGPNCTSAANGSPQLITIQVNGSSKVLTFVVGNPSSTSSTSSLVAQSLKIVNYTDTSGATPYQSVGSAGGYLSTQPVVEVLDGGGNTISTDLSPVVLSITQYPANTGGTGSISGCTGLEVNGYVSFSDCSISTGGTYAIQATVLGSTSLSSPLYYITVAAGGNFLSFTNPNSVVGSCSNASEPSTGEPVAGVSGAAFSTQPAIWVENSSGQQICGWSGTITLAASGGILSTASGSSCTTLTATNGFAQAPTGGCLFAGAYTLVSENSYQQTPYVLTATVTGTPTSAATNATSNPFEVTKYGAATQLAFYVQPIGAGSSSATFASQTISNPFVPLSGNAQAVVAVEDSFGNVVYYGQNSSGTVMGISLSVTEGSTTLSASQDGCAPGTLTGGYYLITGCHGVTNATSNSVTLTATSSISVTTSTFPTTPASGGSCTTVNGTTCTPMVTSGTFSITGAPSQIVFVTQPVAPTNSGSLLTTMPTVAVEDANGNVVTASSGGTVSWTVSPSSGTLSNCTNLTVVSGVVNLQNCTFTGIDGIGYTIAFTITGFSVGTTTYTFSTTASQSITLSLPGAASKLVFATSPIGGAAGSAFTTMPVVYVEDSGGNVVTTTNTSISLVSSGGTLSNCANLAVIGGVANVTGCTFGGLVGTNYTLTAASSGLTSATSNTFTVSGPGPVTQIVLSLTSAGSACYPSILYQGTCVPVATYEDAYGNTVTTDTSAITFQNTGSGGGSVSSTGPSQANGVATETLTGTGVGTISVYAMGSGLTSSTSTFTVNKAPQTVNFYTSGTYATTTTTGTATYSAGGTYQTYAQGSQGGTVSFLTTTSSVCTVNSTSGVISIVAAGTCIITADAAATTNYADSGTTNFTLTIAKAAQTVNFYTSNTYATTTTTGTATYSAGGIYQTYAKGSQNGTITFASTTTSVCTVNSTSGLVTFVTAGSCVITADAATTTNYLDSGTTNFTLTISKANQTITFTAPTRASENSANFTPSGTSSSGLTVTYTLDGTSTGCTLNAGVVDFTAVGTCVIDANQAGNTSYNAATQVQRSITVVNLGFTSLATSGAATNTVTTASITGTSGSKLVIFISFTSNATNNTCGTPTSAAFTGATQIGTTDEFYAGNPYDYLCVYTATATGTAGTVTETDTGTASSGHSPSTDIQVMGITGDNTAVVTNSATNAGTTTAVTYNLGTTPGAESLELDYGAAQYTQGATQPTFSTPTNFTLLSIQQAAGYPSVVGYIFYGDATTPLTGTLSATQNWGSIGLEIQP